MKNLSKIFILFLTCFTLLFGCGGSSSNDDSPDSVYLRITSLKIDGDNATSVSSERGMFFESDNVIPEELNDQGMLYQMIKITDDDTWYICDDPAHSATPVPYQISTEMKITFDGSAAIDPDFVGTITIDTSIVTISGNRQGDGDTYVDFNTVYTGTSLQIEYEKMTEVSPVSDCTKFDKSSDK